MKSRIKIKIALFTLCAFLLISCNDDDVIDIPLTEIELNIADILISVDEVKQIVVNGIPNNATQKIIWSSSDDQIAAIQYNESGLVAGVKGIALGNATLTATSADGSLNKSVDVGVIIKVESILLEEEPISDPAQTKYNVIFTPSNASIQSVTWSSSDSSVATVVDGVITAVAPGVTTITATTDEGSKTASVDIAVSGNPPILGLQYCSASGTGGYNADTVTTSGADANLNYSGTQPNGNYEFYESEKLIVQPGGTFNLSITQSNNWSMTVVWIDWNADKDFADAGERVEVFGMQSQLNDGPFNTTIDVPAEAEPGVVRMRVLTGDAWTTDPDAEPCGEIANSTTKDFNVKVL